MSSWNCDQNIVKYYTEPSGPASMIDGRINWGERFKDMLTPPNEPNKQCKVELASLVGESIGGRKSKTCYPPPNQPNEKFKVEKYPDLPQSKGQSQAFQHTTS